MILPNKYVEPSQSLFYLGAITLDIIQKKRMSLVDLWINFKRSTKENISYTRFLQTLVYLYSAGIISYTKEGEIYNENFKSWNIFSKFRKT